MVIGGVLEESSFHTIGAGEEWIIREGTEDIVILDLATGDLYIDGLVFDNQGLLSPPATDDFIVKDPFGVVMLYIDKDGDIYMRGELVEGYP